MTRDEILSMEAGREMDALIAEKVMGWILHPHKTHWMIYEGDQTKTMRPKYRNYGDFFPSTNIAAAWEVALWLREYWGQFDLLAGLEWHCWHDLEHTKPEDKWGMGDTAPLAICRAALLTTLDE